MKLGRARCKHEPDMCKRPGALALRDQGAGQVVHYNQLMYDLLVHCVFIFKSSFDV